MQKHIYTICVLLQLLIFIGCESTDDEFGSRRIDFQLVPIDSIGIETGDSCYVFAKIFDACFLNPDRIAISDPRFQEARIFSRSGDHMYSVSAVGNGPGECNYPDDLTRLNNGNLLIGSYYDRKALVFDTSFVFVREILFDNPSNLFRLQPYGDSSFAGMYLFHDMNSFTGGNGLARWHDAAEPEYVYIENSAPIDMDYKYQVTTSLCYTVMSDTMLWVSKYSTDEYTIDCYAPDGSIVQTISVPYSEHGKSEDFIRRELERARLSYIEATGSDAGFNIDLIRTHGAISDLAMDAEGMLWVRRGFAEDAPIYDIYDDGGQYMYSCEVALPCWQEVNRWKLVIDEYGYLAIPLNPEIYPLVYILEIREIGH